MLLVVVGGCCNFSVAYTRILSASEPVDWASRSHAAFLRPAAAAGAPFSTGRVESVAAGASIGQGQPCLVGMDLGRVGGNPDWAPMQG